ncbi:sugar-transfer associated ATP-grasp domain-containing protein [Wukongibacter sp. M2B1]|uniref:sugar-transfer associated ATP-grasp domain-containing protein n=1 Tax=Wukongibacter sp. M2B1 TaxID=3088895 RepID=UPI003D7ACB28
MELSKNIKKIKNSYYMLKLRALNHRIYYRNGYDRMKKAMEIYKKFKDKKPRMQILNEIRLCKKYWGCYPFHYFRYGLYKKNRELSEEALLDYIPEFFFYKIFLPYYDSDKYSILTEDKNITEALFNRLNISQPRTLFRLIANKFYDEDYNIIKFDDILRKLNKMQIRKIFMKPVNGDGGYGILIFHIKDGEYYTKDRMYLNEELLRILGEQAEYIFQEGIEQDHSTAKIYPKSVNTFRITTVNKEGEASIVCATLRLGKDEMEIDNGTQGGIVLGIDIETGRCMEYGITETGEKFFRHPDSGFIFRDYEITKWNEIKEFTINCANKLPQFTYLGWDIALTKDGLTAIETNLGFGIDHYQVPLGGLRRIFGIDDPMFYWRNLHSKSV